MDENYILTEADKTLMKHFYNELYKINHEADVIEFYKSHIDLYEKVTFLIGGEQYKVDIAKKLKSLFNDDISSKLIIDIGAGTGLLGEILYQHGFECLDGLDISKDMLERCREKKIYKNLFEVPLTSAPTKGIKENTYDAAVSAGCYLEGHIPLDTLEELARMVKSGGYIIYSLNDPNFKMNYMEVQGRFMKENKLELISMQLIQYKREITLNFEFIYGYEIVFKVL